MARKTPSSAKAPGTRRPEVRSGEPRTGRRSTTAGPKSAVPPEPPRIAEPKAGAIQAAGPWHPLLGAHMSVAGGIHHALEAAAAHRTCAVQVFTKNANQWNAKPLSAEAIALFAETRARLGPFEIASHDSYLINLSSPNPELRAKSLAAFVDEIERCEALDIPRLVFHPGAHMGEGEPAGLERIADSVRAAIRTTRGYRTRLLFENTAGQGTNLGWRIEHLEILLSEVGDPARTGVCIDTCHLLAAGYEIRTEDGYAAVRAELDTRIGLPAIGWFHLNDSKTPLGSRVDRHHHIGRGHIGAGPFRFFLTDPVFRGVPMVIETEKVEDWDRKNLARLRRLSRVA